jgi:mRNA interferase MazF
MDTVFLCFQIRSLDPNRFPDRPAGRMPDDAMRRVEAAVRRCLGL